MKVTLEFQSEVEASLQELFDYHSHPLAFYRLVPPWDMIRVIHRDPDLSVGSKAHIQLKLGGVKKDFITNRIECDSPHGFTDEQELGPFKSYKHDHIFTRKKDKTYIIDHLVYELPGMFFGHVVGGWFVKSSFKRMFRYRHKVIAEDFKHLSLQKEKKRLKVLISGCTGFVGRQLSLALDLFGLDVHHLVRKHSNHSKEIFWDIENLALDEKLLEGFDYVIHLCGENVSDKRWSKSQKKKIYESRVNTTKFLAAKLESLSRPPKGFFVASGAHIYGDCSNTQVDEETPPASSFLSEVVSAWETASREFTKGRVVNMRFGMVLGLRGGALRKLVKIFRTNLGAIMGDGTQYISWIVIDDLIYQIYHLLLDERASGAYNFVTPNPVTNAEFSKMLAKILGKSLFLKLPKKLISWVFGKMGKELLLSDLKVSPKRLNERQSYFSYPTLFDALKHLFGK